MGKPDVVEVMTHRLHHHLTNKDELPPLLDMDSETDVGPEETYIAGIKLSSVSKAILEELDPQTWKEVTATIRSKASPTNQHELQYAVADYFLLRDHQELDLSYFLIEKFDAGVTVRRLDAGWVSPHPLLRSAGIIE
jgi:hypothetical protein